MTPANQKAEIDVEFEQALVSAVKGFPCIYSKDHPSFINCVHNRFAWNRISIILRKDILDCQNRWYAIYQTFLYKLKREDITTWLHYESLKELLPSMAHSYSEFIQIKLPVADLRPSPQQKEQFFKELMLHRLRLLNPETPLEQIQKFWATTVDKLNSLPGETQVSVIHWHKFWWDLKLQSLEAGSKLHIMGAGRNKFFTEDYQNFINFYTIQCSTAAAIFGSIGRNTEFGCSGAPTHRCQKCSSPLTILDEVLCQICESIPKNYCDICLMINNKESMVYAVKNWSSIAKSLLPLKARSFAKVLVCFHCSISLKTKATVAWRACRICETYQQPIENLYYSENEFLLKVFQKATNTTFSAMDGLPGYICKMCKVLMNQFNNFYMLFSRSQDRLLEFQRTKFIYIDTSEVEKLSITELPEALPITSKTQPAQGPVGLLNPKIPNTQVPTTSQTKMQHKPKPKFLISKPTTKRLSTGGIPTKSVSGATMHSGSLSTEMSKRLCILPSKIKEVVSLQQMSSSCENPRGVSAALEPTKAVKIILPDIIKNELRSMSAEKAPLFSKNTGLRIEKRLCATNPVVFTVSGDQEDQPPVFCISKSASAGEISNLAPAGDERKIVRDSQTTTKTQDDGYTSPPNPNVLPSTQITTDSEISLNASTLSVESSYCLPKQNASTNTEDAFRPDGFATKPIQSQSGGFLQFAPSQDFHNKFVSALCPPKMTELSAHSILSVPEEQQGLQTQACQPQSRVPNYWGPVDEFQITSVLENISQNTIQQPLANPLLFIPNAVLSSEIPRLDDIKEETADKYEAQSAMDSFNLKNLSTNANVKQEPIVEGNSFEYICPSFVLSSVEHQPNQQVINAPPWQCIR